MSTVGGGVNIVTEGLVLYLDAANTKSYPGSGTTWTDVSKGGNNGTLTNGPTFNSGNGGSIVFDGVNDYVPLSSHIPITNIFTINVWCVFNELGFTGPGFTKRKTLISYDYPYAANRGFCFIGSANNGSDFFISLGQDQKFTSSTTGYVTLNTPIMLTAVANAGNSLMKLYKNGSEVNYNVQADANINLSYTSLPNIGVMLPSGQNFMNGGIYNINIYNRALTAQEVLQNYNATKTRFGL
jgi:hypothetical protein